MIKAVCFDLDDTLFDYKSFMSEAEKYLCRITGKFTGVPLPRCVKVYYQLKRDLYRSRPYDPTIFDWRVRISNLLARIGRRPSESMVEVLFNDFWGSFLSTIEPYPEAQSTLETLKKQGRKTAVISNGMRDQQAMKIDRLGLTSFLDAQFFSEDVGSNKPAPAIFRHALSVLDVSPSQSLMVGDLCYVDIRGARIAGMFTCHLKAGAYADLVPKDVCEEPDFTIRRLGDLQSTLEAL